MLYIFFFLGIIVIDIEYFMIFTKLLNSKFLYHFLNNLLEYFFSRL